jgi:hypothetical protein
VPRQFSWIDQRLLRHQHIQGRSPESLALYLFLCTVADGQGLSFYSEPALAKSLSLSLETLRAARQELSAHGLIAFRRPFYQVLSLEPSASSPSHSMPTPEPRLGETKSMSEILRAILQEPKP